MNEIQMVIAWAAARVQIMRDNGDDAGFSTLEWVALAGVIIIAAIAVATVLMTKAKTAAGKVNVQ
jgi:hypothetical protein